MFENWNATALFGGIILVGSFSIMGIMAFQGKLEVEQVLPMIGTWVGVIITGFLANKVINDSIKRINGNNQPKQG
jgi:hypothetical protein